MIAIGFSTTSGILSRVVRWFTNSDVSHAFVYFDDERLGGRFIIDADWDGYRVRPFHSIFKSASVVYLLTPKHPTAGLIPACARWLGSPYDYSGLVGAGVAIAGRWGKRKWKNPTQDAKALFCSEAIVAALQQIQYPGAEKFDPSTTTPEDLMAFFLAERK